MVPALQTLCHVAGEVIARTRQYSLLVVRRLLNPFGPRPNPWSVNGLTKQELGAKMWKRGVPAKVHPHAVQSLAMLV